MEGRGITGTYSSLKSSFKITCPLAGIPPPRRPPPHPAVVYLLSSQEARSAAWLRLLARYPVLSLSAYSRPSTLPQPLGMRECLCNQPVVTHCSFLPFLVLLCLLSPGLVGLVTTPPEFQPKWGACRLLPGRAGEQSRCWVRTIRAVSQPHRRGRKVA